MELPFTEGAGTVAHDISGNGNDATFCSSGSAPVWTSIGVAFSEADGATESCFDTAVTNWGALFIYACPYAGAIPNNYVTQANGFTASGLWGPTTLSDGLGFTGTPYGAATYGIVPTLFYVPNNIYPTYTTQIEGGCHVYGITLGSTASGTADRIYVDGVEQSYSSQGSSAALAATTGHYQVGCTANCAGGHWFEGVVSYMVAGAAGQQYTSQQVVAETNYVRAHVEPRGAGEFPYAATTDDTIVAIGDSLTAGAHGNSPEWPFLLQTNQSYAVSDLGLYSVWAQDLAAIWPQRENSYYSPLATKQYCHIWAGTNDVSSGQGQMPSSAWQGLEALARDCLAAGGIPIVATMISRQGFDTQKNQLNALIRAGWQQAGYAALDDIAANYPQLGADGAWANTTYFYTDGIHLTGPNGLCDMSTGYGIVCVAVSGVVNQLDAAERWRLAEPRGEARAKAAAASSAAQRRLASLLRWQ